MENFPEPHVLASLAVAVRAYMGPMITDDQALDEALKWFRLAQVKIEVKREELRIEAERTDQLASLFHTPDNQARLKFMPKKRADEVRKFLQERSSGELTSLRNVSKGRTVEQKMRDFFVDSALLVGETSEAGEKRFLAWLGQPHVDADGTEAYELPVSDVHRFRRWLRELPRLEALWRKGRKTGLNISALDIRVRLVIAATGDQAKAEELRRFYSDDPSGEELSRKIVSELRSPTFENQRTRRQ